MDLFDKIKKAEYLQEARIAIDQGIYPFFLPLEETEGTEVIINGRRLIMLGSNNYLGLTTHPKVKESSN